MPIFHAKKHLYAALILSLAAGLGLVSPAVAQIPSHDADNATPNPTFTPTGKPLSLSPESNPVAPTIQEPVKPTPPVPPAKPVGIGAPVQSTVLNDIPPESVGLLSANEGGLGANLWRGTSHAFVDRLMPLVALPTFSPALNNLAARFLLTTAAAPEGAAYGSASLTSLRVQKLVELGRVVEAWNLAVISHPGQIDDAVLRQTAETMLLTPYANDICGKISDIIKNHTDSEWQKLLLVCQLRGKDYKAAQLTLDLLHSLNIKDDVFFDLAEKNILGGHKQLPHQLASLTPLTLALLRLIDLPLHDELFAHPDASLIPELLKTKAVNDKTRLELAVRAAQRGLITTTDLEEVYRSQVFQNLDLSTSIEKGPRLQAQSYQAALQEKDPSKKVMDIVRFLQSLEASSLSGVAPQVGIDLLADIKPSAEFAPVSDQIVLLYLLANKPDAALLWFNVARAVAPSQPNVATGLFNMWPLLVLAGLETDHDYARDLSIWMDDRLNANDARGNGHAIKTLTASLLLLLESNGFAVPAEQWARVMEAPVFEKQVEPPPLLLEQLRTAGTSNRRGESIMDALLISGTPDLSLSSKLDIIRALRLSGLNADAAAYTREVATGLIFERAAVP